MLTTIRQYLETSTLISRERVGHKVTGWFGMSAAAGSSFPFLCDQTWPGFTQFMISLQHVCSAAESAVPLLRHCLYNLVSTSVITQLDHSSVCFPLL